MQDAAEQPFLQRARALVTPDISDARLEELVRLAVHIAYTDGKPLTPDALIEGLRRALVAQW